MSRALVTGIWRRKRDTPGHWWYRCGGEGCGHRLAEYREGDKNPLSLEPGYSNTGYEDGIFRRSSSPKRHYVSRGKLRRELLRKLGPRGTYQNPPTALDPHPKVRVLVFDYLTPGAELPALVLCHDPHCGALNLVDLPKGVDLPPTVC